MKKLVAFLLMFLTGCASMPTSEKLYLAASAADLATTHQGIANHGGYEANPVLRIAGDDAEAVLITGAVLTVGYLVYVKWLRKKYGNKTADSLFWLGTGVRLAAASWNLGQMILL